MLVSEMSLFSTGKIVWSSALVSSKLKTSIENKRMAQRMASDMYASELSELRVPGPMEVSLLFCSDLRMCSVCYCLARDSL